MENNKLLHYELTQPKSNLVLVASYFFIVLGLFLMAFGNPIIGFFFAAGAGLNVSYKKGIYFDLENRKFLQYETYFTVKTGKWKNLNTFKELTILAKTKTSRIYGRSGASISDTFKTYDSFMVDETHRQKVLLNSCLDADEAYAKVKSLSEKLNLPFVKYNPKISESSRQKR